MKITKKMMHESSGGGRRMEMILDSKIVEHSSIRRAVLLDNSPSVFDREFAYYELMYLICDERAERLERGK